MSAAEQLDDFEHGDAYEPAGDDIDTSFVAPLERAPIPEAPIRKAGGAAAPQREVDRLYPYDRLAPMVMARDLDRLRCMPDRDQAQQLLDLWRVLNPLWKDGTAAKWREWENQARDEEDLKRLTALGERTLKGGLGDEAKQLAHAILMASAGYQGMQMRRDLPSLREFERELRKLRGR